jgi:mevalonate kinase
LDAYNYRYQNFLQDIQSGLRFSSNIPQGYGAGSSGALTAAVFDTYCTPEESLTLKQKQAILGLMEAHFHGKSSGFDPLVSLENQVLFIDQNKVIQTPKKPVIKQPEFQYFLLDTQQSRSTGPLVERFLKDSEDASYAFSITDQLVPWVDQAIEAYLNADEESLWGHFGNIARFQLEHFKGMIPEQFRGVWQQGLDSNDFKIKLCGAGGGGYLLGMAKRSVDLEYISPTYGVIPLRLYG